MANYDWYRKEVITEILNLASAISAQTLLKDKELKKLLKKNKQGDDTTLTIRINPYKK